MDSLIYFFAAFVLIAALLAGIAVWAQRSPAIKTAALVLAGLLMAAGYAGLVDILGKPKPASMEWFKSASRDARVLGARLHEGKAIYLWLELDGGAAPRAYRLPWSRKAALELQRARRQAKAKGTALRMRAPFRPKRDRSKPMFYADPPPPLPPKESGAG